MTVLYGLIINRNTLTLLSRCKSSFCDICSFGSAESTPRLAHLSGHGYRSLESRRDVCLATTAFKVVRGIYECPQLLDAFGLLAPSNYLRARECDLFMMPMGRTDVIVGHPVLRSVGMLNFVHRDNYVLSMSFYDF